MRHGVRWIVLAVAGLSLTAISPHGMREPSPSPTPHPRPRASARPSLAAALRRDLVEYLNARSKSEHISVLSLSVSRSPSAPLITTTASLSVFGTSNTVTADSLFQIGSNTKAFTAAAMLQLEAEKKLTIDQTVGRWLPQYPQWKTITIRRLLDMTSGIATYDDTQTFQRAFATDPYRDFSPQELIAYVASAPLHRGFYYSNTAYLLAQLIIERASGASYGDQLRRRFFGTLGLHHTYFDANIYAAAIRERTVPGFYVNVGAENRGLKPLYGKNVRDWSLSWAQGAGGIVASPSDVVRWVRALFEGPVLQAAQRKELLKINSTKTAKPIGVTTTNDPGGFGLGVVQVLQPPIGRFWFYKGETFGYRLAYAYVPKADLIYAVGANSAPPGNEDHIGQLMTAVYNTLQSYQK